MTREEELEKENAVLKDEVARLKKWVDLLDNAVKDSRVALRQAVDLASFGQRRR